MSYDQDAHLLYENVMNLFAVLSYKRISPKDRMDMIHNLFTLMKGLAQDLKTLIRIALMGALRLEREKVVNDPIALFLDKLHVLVIGGCNPLTRRAIQSTDEDDMPRVSPGGDAGCAAFVDPRLLPENTGDYPFSGSAPREGSEESTDSSLPSNLCFQCNSTVEENSVRCESCGITAAAPTPLPHDPDDDWDQPTIRGRCWPGVRAASRLEQYSSRMNAALSRL
jgi:hypothetical protein